MRVWVCTIPAFGTVRFPLCRYTLFSPTGVEISPWPGSPISGRGCIRGYDISSFNTLPKVS